MTQELIQEYETTVAETDKTTLNGLSDSLAAAIEAIVETVDIHDSVKDDVAETSNKLANIGLESICLRLGVPYNDTLVIPAMEAVGGNVDKLALLKTASAAVGKVILKIINGIIRMVKFFITKIRNFCKYMVSTSRKLELEAKKIDGEVKAFISSEKNPVRNTVHINLSNAAEVLNLTDGLHPKPPTLATEAVQIQQKESEAVAIIEDLSKRHVEFTEKWIDWLDKLFAQFTGLNSTAINLTKVKILDHVSEDEEENSAPTREINRILGLDPETPVNKQTVHLTEAYNNLIQDLKRLPFKLNEKTDSFINYGYFANLSYISLHLSKGAYTSENSILSSHIRIEHSEKKKENDSIQLQPVLELENIRNTLQLAIQVNKSSYDMTKAMSSLEKVYGDIEKMLEKLSQLHNYNDSLKHVSKHLLNIVASAVRTSGPLTTELSVKNIQLTKALIAYSRSSFAQYVKE